MASRAAWQASDGRIIFFAAERAAGLGLDHAHFVFRQIEDRAQRFVHVVRALQRAPHRYAALRAVFGDDAVVLNVEMLLRAGAILALDDVRGAGPRGVHVAFFEQKALEEIVGAPHNRVLPLALFDGEDRRQRIVLDVHGADRFAQLVLVGMREQHDRLPRSGSPCRRQGRAGRPQ